jgi:DNA-binding MarR family transcriptional regulator
MELEKSIQQRTAFKNQRHKLVVNLMFTGNWITQLMAKRIKPFGITPQQYNVLRILRGQYPKNISVSSIAERMLDKSSNVGRLLDKMIQKNLIEVGNCHKDRRAKDIIILQKGLDLLDTIDKETLAMEESIEINEEDAKLVNLLLDALRGEE